MKSISVTNQFHSLALTISISQVSSYNIAQSSSINVAIKVCLKKYIHILNAHALSVTRITNQNTFYSLSLLPRNIHNIDLQKLGLHT